MSRRRTLYTRVLFLMTSILLGIFAFIIYVMPSKITITLSYRIDNVEGVEINNIKLTNFDKAPKIDANKPVSQSNFYNNINNHDKYINIFGYEFKGWKVNNSIDLKPETTFNRSATIYGVLQPYKYRVYLDFSDHTNADATNDFEPVSSELGFHKEGKRYVKELYFGEALVLPSAQNTQGKYMFVQGDLSTDGKVLSNWYSARGTELEEFKGGANLTQSIIEYENIFVRNEINPDAFYGSFTFKPQFVDRKAVINFRYGLTTDELLDDKSEDKKVETVEINRGIIPVNDVFIKDTSDLVQFGENYKHKEFLGWHEAVLDSFGKPIVDINGQIRLNPTAYNFATKPFYVDQINLYAKYDNKTYTMTFDLNIPASIIDLGDIEEINTFNKRFVDDREYKYQSKKYDDAGISNKLLEINPPPFITGFRFDGWYRVQFDIYGQIINGNNDTNMFDKFDFQNDLIESNFTLYAKWSVDTSENDLGKIERFQTTTKVDAGETVAVITGMNRTVPFDKYVIVPLVDKDGNRITEIKKDSFRFHDIETIVISRNIKVIEDGAFSFQDATVDQLPRIKSIIVSTQNQNYRDIDGMLFDKLGKKLIYYPAAKPAENLIIGREGDAVDEIGAWAFKDAYNLLSVEINVPTIGNFAFRNTIRGARNSSKLTSVVLKEKIESIGNGVFVGNDKLQGFTIVGNAKFSYSTSNKTLVISTGTSTSRLLHVLESHTTPTLPLRIGNASYIDSYAFAFSKVTNVVFTGVREIYAEAFVFSSIQSIKFENASLTLSKIVEGAFTQMNSLIEVNFKDSAGMAPFNLNMFGDTNDPTFKMPEQIYLPVGVNSINLGNVSKLTSAKFANVTFHANATAAQDLRVKYPDFNLTIVEY